MQYLRIYIQKKFLVEYFNIQKKLVHDLIKNDMGRKFLFINELIKSVGKIYIDIDQAAIDKLIIKEINKDTDEFEILFKELGKTLKIKQCPINLSTPEQILNTGNKTIQPHYLLLDCDQNQAKNYQKTLGIICISTQLIMSKEIYSLDIKHILKNNPINLNSYTKNLNQSHSIIIEDPYIYTIDLKFLENIILSLYNNQFNNNPLHILLVGQNKNINNPKIRPKEKEDFIKFKKELLCFIDSFNDSYENKVIIELILIGSNIKLHDRHILSNSFWIVSGHSFKEVYDTNTEWQYRPIGTYFHQFKDRLSFVNSAIKTKSYSTYKHLYKKNPLENNQYNILIT